MNLFEQFGFAAVEMPKKEEKKVETKKSSKAKKETKPKVVTYDLPVKVYFGYGEPLVITEKQDGTTSMTEAELMEAFTKYSSWPKGFYKIIECGEDLVASTIASPIYKGTIKVNKDTKMWLSGKIFDLTSIMTDEVCDVEVSELMKLAFSELPIFGSENDIVILSKDNFIMPVPKGNVTGGTKLKFPVRLFVIGRDNMTISEGMYQQFIQKKEAKSKKKDISEIEIKAVKNIDIEIIKEIITETYPEYQARFLLNYNQAANMVLVAMDNKFNTETSKTKKKLFPTDATVSLVFTKITLNPDLFGGELEVEEQEIIKVLSKDFPEYSKERTTLSYDEELNLIVPILKSATKGAGLIEHVETDERAAELVGDGSKYYCYTKDVEGNRLRMEGIPGFANFTVSLDGNDGLNHFNYLLPKIDTKYFLKACRFFEEVCKRHDTEAALQLFYSRQRNDYFLYCPEQKVEYARVTVTRDFELEHDPDNILVMELHSHGRINCTFSSVDNADEKATRFFGVMYGYADNHFSQVDFRAGCAGHYVKVVPCEIFDVENSTEDHYKKYDFDKWLERLEVA